MKIDIWSDVICPFCYIGKRKLEAALEQTGIQAEIEWHSFELSPDSPRYHGVSLPETMSQMYGISRERALAILKHEEQEASRMGLDFQWEIAKPGNTFDVHRLIHLAKFYELGDKAKERFLKAYFTEGQDIGDQQVLRALALEIGLPADKIDDVLENNLFADEVRFDEWDARNRGIRGVPYFVINDSATVSGAREVNEFINVLRDQVDLLASQAEAGICNGGFCEIKK